MQSKAGPSRAIGNMQCVMSNGQNVWANSWFSFFLTEMTHKYVIHSQRPHFPCKEHAFLMILVNTLHPEGYEKERILWCRQFHSVWWCLTRVRLGSCVSLWDHFLYYPRLVTSAYHQSPEMQLVPGTCTRYLYWDQLPGPWYTVLT